MSNDPNIDQKAAILHRNGFLRDQDLADSARIEVRWRIFKSTPQKTVRSKKAEKEEAAA